MANSTRDLTLDDDAPQIGNERMLSLCLHNASPPPSPPFRLGRPRLRMKNASDRETVPEHQRPRAQDPRRAAPGRPLRGAPRRSPRAARRRAARAGRRVQGRHGRAQRAGRGRLGGLRRGHERGRGAVPLGRRGGRRRVICELGWFDVRVFGACGARHGSGSELQYSINFKPLLPAANQNKPRGK